MADTPPGPTTGSMNVDGYHDGTQQASENAPQPLPDGTRCEKPAAVRRIGAVARVDPRLVYRIWFIRQANGMTGYAFSKRTGIPKGRVYEMMNATRDTTLEHVLIIADAFARPTADVFAEFATIAARIEERASVRIEGSLPGHADYQTASELAAEDMIRAMRAARKSEPNDGDE